MSATPKQMQSATHMIQLREPEPIIKEERDPPRRRNRNDRKLFTVRTRYRSTRKDAKSNGHIWVQGHRRYI